MEIKIAAIQLNSRQNEPEYNRQKAVHLVREAASHGAKIISLPELWVPGYFFTFHMIDKLAEPADGETVKLFQKLALELETVLIVPFLEIEEKAETTRHYISAAVIDADGGLCGIYRKSLLWGDEKYRYSAGKKSYPVFKTRYGMLGILICYDAEFPEPARVLTLKGAELIIVPSVWSIAGETRWDIQLPARALDNALYVLGVNACGQNICGKSKLINPEGFILEEAPRLDETILYGNVNFDNVKETRKKLPYLTDYPVSFTPDEEL